mgnify:CR=1 FL=1
MRAVTGYPFTELLLTNFHTCSYQKISYFTPKLNPFALAREVERQKKELAMAANALLADYQGDPELTTFNALDSVDFDA